MNLNVEGLLDEMKQKAKRNILPILKISTSIDKSIFSFFLLNLTSVS